MAMKAEAALRAEMARQERLERMKERKAAAKTVEGRTKKLAKSMGDKFTVRAHLHVHLRTRTRSRKSKGRTLRCQEARRQKTYASS